MTKKHTPQEVNKWLDKWELELKKLAPPGYSVARAMRNALNLLQAPRAYSGAAALLESTQRSIFACMMSVVEMGLQPNGRHAHFVAYRHRKAGTVVCTLLVDWKGLVWLANQSGQLRCPPVSRLVYEREVPDFQVTSGTDERIEHVIYTGPDDPGDVTHAYAMFQFKTGASTFELMSRSQIDHVRNCSPNAKRGAWVEHFEEMARKCPLRRGCKRQELSYQMGVALEADDAADMGWAPRRIGDDVVPPPSDEEMERALETKPEENANDGHADRESSGEGDRSVARPQLHADEGDGGGAAVDQNRTSSDGEASDGNERDEAVTGCHPVANR